MIKKMFFMIRKRSFMIRKMFFMVRKRSFMIRKMFFMIRKMFFYEKNPRMKFRFLTSFSRGPGICPLQWLHFGICPWNMSITVTTNWNMSREYVHYSDYTLEYVQGICPLQWLHFGKIVTALSGTHSILLQFYCHLLIFHLF